MKITSRIAAGFALVASCVTLQPISFAAAAKPADRPFNPADIVLTPIPRSAIHHGAAHGPRVRFWESTSGNWSGYAVPLDTSGVTDLFSSVQGTWQVPQVIKSLSGTTTYSSTWIGLDGYSNGTVEQTGTEQDYTSKGQKNYAWFEMYPAGAYMITNFPVNAGDTITASVVWTGKTTIKGSRGKTTSADVFQLKIKNVTRNISYTVPSSYTTIPTAGRASAEWIAEAPWSGKILPLADFGTAMFWNCTASSTGSGGSLAPINFWPADPLTMIDPSGGTAVPSDLSDLGTAFSVTWSP